MATRVLVVDDDPDFRESLRAFLEASGFSVLEASNGREGLRVAAIERPDVILMDIVMRGQPEGLSVVRQIRVSETLKDTPVILLSSLHPVLPGFPSSPGDEPPGHDAFFSKPVDLPNLVERIREYAAAGRHGLGSSGSEPDQG